MKLDHLMVTGYKTIATKLPQWLEFLQDNFKLPRL